MVEGKNDAKDVMEILSKIQRRNDLVVIPLIGDSSIVGQAALPAIDGIAAEDSPDFSHLSKHDSIMSSRLRGSKLCLFFRLSNFYDFNSGLFSLNDPDLRAFYVKMFC